MQKTKQNSIQETCIRKSESPNQSQQKWQEDIILMTKQELNWKEAYQMAFQCTKSTKLITFNFKFLHRRIATNNFLKKIGLVDSEKCTFCEHETEKHAHLFWTCPKSFLDQLQSMVTVLPSYL